jgi:hypothetical protein
MTHSRIVVGEKKPIVGESMIWRQVEFSESGDTKNLLRNFCINPSQPAYYPSGDVYPNKNPRNTTDIARIFDTARRIGQGTEEGVALLPKR